MLGRSRGFVLVSVALASACGGSTSPGDLFDGKPSDTDSDDAGSGVDGGGSGAAGSAGAAGGATGFAGGAGMAGGGVAGGGTAGAGAAGASAYTLDNVCASIGPEVCTVRKPCCVEAGIPFNEAECVARLQKDCAASAAAARSGTVTFHPEYVAPCLTTMKTVYANCHPQIVELLQVFGVARQCTSVFEGNGPSGAPCVRDSDCAQPIDEHSFAQCDAGKCASQTLVLLGPDAECSFQEGTQALCNAGLYCDVDYLAGKQTGICRTAVPLGGPCDPTKPISLECGLGSRCDKGSAVCVHGFVAGSACENDLDCASLKCGETSKLCELGNSIVDAQDCGG